MSSHANMFPATAAAPSPEPDLSPESVAALLERDVKNKEEKAPSGVRCRANPVALNRKDSKVLRIRPTREAQTTASRTS